MIIFLIVAAVVLWLLWKLLLWLCGVLVIAVPYIIGILLTILGLALAAGVVWLFLPHRESKDKSRRS